MTRADQRRGDLPFLVGVAGGPASGKSLVCQKIIERLGHGHDYFNKQVNVISIESFYRDLTPAEQEAATRGEFDFDHPDAFEFTKLVDMIHALQRGEAVDVPVYDFDRNKIIASKKLENTDVLLVEGILVFYDKRVRELFKMKLFVDADADIRLARRVRRDTIERQRPLSSVLNVYMNKVKPDFEEFCLPTKKYADVIIPRGGENDVAIDLLVQHIHDILKSPRGSPFDARATNGQNGRYSEEDDGGSSSGRSSRKGHRKPETVGRPH
ncbi:unnamed protein product, partial [Mesorhabditis belari]|uniref:uridine/cytidine kinase n=1 Tax=Mesorhabditis belari TaxID=2138241 RepID=A0AAF3FFW0_9BILA